MPVMTFYLRERSRDGQSRAIMGYLVNAYGKDDTLYPKQPRDRALVDQRLYFDIGTLYPRYLNLYAPMIFQGQAYDEEKAAKLNEALGWLNTMLEGRNFVAGNNLTIADIAIALGFDINAHENVTKWFERTKKALEPHGYMEIDHAGGQALAQFMKSKN
ncbi:Glutathione S-transferase D7 [Eumeta japonica]|uniref:Glutathione S-transferase D7 n=1 Tax=Eumeta variegata TaxID=151549 RepID=A0A4C1T1L0_EUMVA|nr:Glutathione S-transferase D7 [Eumeta japonica]